MTRPSGLDGSLQISRTAKKVSFAHGYPTTSSQSSFTGVSLGYTDSGAASNLAVRAERPDNILHRGRLALQ